MRASDRRNRRIAAIVALVSFGFSSSIAIAQTVQSPLIVDVDFGNCDFSGWNNMIGSNPNTITTTVVRSGRCAMRSDLDYWENPGTNNKNEAAPDVGKHKWDTDYWYGFSVYLPPDWDDDGVKWSLVFQIHQLADPGEPGASPPVSLAPDASGVWRVWRRWFAEEFNPTTSVDQTSYIAGPLQKGVWTDWVFHIKFSFAGNGLLQVWRDGKQVVDVAGPIGYNNEYGPSAPKIGLYLGWRDPLVATHLTVYHDEFRMAGPGGSYADVAPRAPEMKPNAPVSLDVQ